MKSSAAAALSGTKVWADFLFWHAAAVKAALLLFLIVFIQHLNTPGSSSAILITTDPKQLVSRHHLYSAGVHREARLMNAQLNSPPPINLNWLGKWQEGTQQICSVDPRIPPRHKITLIFCWCSENILPTKHPPPPSQPPSVFWQKAEAWSRSASPGWGGLRGVKLTSCCWSCLTAVKAEKWSRQQVE